jgi:hypothetical protein
MLDGDEHELPTRSKGETRMSARVLLLVERRQVDGALVFMVQFVAGCRVVGVSYFVESENECMQHE